MILEDPRMVGHTDGFQSCIQCGICTSGCPAARFTDYSPREIARRALDGDETLLTDDSVWYCYYCYTCQSRCPRKNSVAVINQVIRGYQVEHGHGAPHVRAVRHLVPALLRRRHGRRPAPLLPRHHGGLRSEVPASTWSTCSSSASSSAWGRSSPTRRPSPRCAPSWRRPASRRAWRASAPGAKSAPEDT